ncbi:M14 family zinc carboxypeptidase [Egicoccus sp. AB-alg2]|uniref:M14 family zinc carboxypeptidase n=1 Tax=Egicoccus sp. AB-alg2 TaxID=3242693 RepID=UPI00359F07B8
MRLASGLAAVTLAGALLPGAAAPAEAFPEESRCHRNLPTAISGHIDHAELGRTLEQLERTSRGAIEVDVAGYTNHGREIWTARVGEGDQVVLVNSQIHGNEKHNVHAVLNILKTLSTNSPQAQQIREAVTLVFVPMLNADGGEANQRQNVMTWDEVVADFPQLEGARRAWNFNTNNQGFDVNRDFNPDLDYVPDPADFPGSSAGTGWYITPEAQTLRDVYAALEDEFGVVDVFVDLHNQGPCYTGDGLDGYSPLSLSARFIADPSEHGDWPLFDYDASRQANLAVHDALQIGNSPYGAITLYPQNINLPGTALGSFALRGSATVLFETSGNSTSTGQKRMGMAIKQIEVGLMGLIEAVADGSWRDLDPERYEDIPHRQNAN